MSTLGGMSAAAADGLASIGAPAPVAVPIATAVSKKSARKTAKTPTKASLKDLAGGAYRLTLRAQDPWGGESSQSIVLVAAQAGPGKKALALRKKKNYNTALIYLRLLVRDPGCGEAIRFELAACGLRLSEHTHAVESRTADPCLDQFARLVHGHEIDPAERLKQAKWVQPEDLFYLGFHFVEGDKLEREFGAKALRLLLKRSPRSKIARDARSKLRSAGLS